MAADGTIFTSHWLCLGGNVRHLHIRDLIAKVIHLDTARGTVVAAQDRTQVIYETEWQVVGSHNLPQSTATTASCDGHWTSSYVLDQPSNKLQLDIGPFGQYATAGAAVHTCAAQTILLQTVAAHAGRGSSLGLVTQAAQPISRTPTGCFVKSHRSVEALSMQSMLRVAAQEFGMIQWSSVDSGLSCPQPTE